MPSSNANHASSVSLLPPIRRPDWVKWLLESRREATATDRSVVATQRDDGDRGRTRPPTILRQPQLSPVRTCVDVAGRTLLWLRKTHVGSAATRNCPKTAREPHKTPNAPAVALKLVRTPRRTPLHPLPGALWWHSSRATPPMSTIATSPALYATLQGQQAQRSVGAEKRRRHWRVSRYRSVARPIQVPRARS